MAGVLGAVPVGQLFRRCVDNCPIELAPCQACPAGQSCLLAPPTCDSCKRNYCGVDPSDAASIPQTNESRTNVGAIAGGVAGGVAVIAILTYLVWRFCVKAKRQEYEQDNWGVEHEDSSSTEKDFAMRRDARASTHTVGSIASTVLTRASNIIQIAYIPGVTNRSAPSTPGLLVPPVPPIPIALSSPGGSSRYEQEHFFMPGDLRDSTWSGVSDRTSYARTSYARTSVASTIYGKNAVVSPVPAQTVIRGKAAVVSVKSNGAATGELTPPVPSVDYGRYGPKSPAFSIGETFLNSASAATNVRPQVVRVPSTRKKDSVQSIAELEARPLGRDSNALTIIDDTPAVEQGPFKDPQEVRRHPSGGSLSALIEDATRRAHEKGEGDSKVGDKKGKTPFGDENEVKEI